MPANLPTEAQLALEEYEKATTLQAKISALQKFIALCPKHKGTEKILKWAKTQLAKLRAQLERRRKATTSAPPAFSVKKEADIQVVLLGVPQSGKTTLLRWLCDSEIPDKRIFPNVGIFNYHGAEFQIVDLPSIFTSDIDKIPNGRALFGIARNADLIAFVIDLTQDVEWQYNLLINACENARIAIGRRPPITFKKTSSGGINIFGIQYSPLPKKEIEELLRSHGILNCQLIFHDYCTVDDLIHAIDKKYVFKKAIIIATKGDCPGTKPSWEKLKQITRIPMVAVSAVKNIGKSKVGELIKRTLDLIFVWTKDDKGIASKAMILKRGAKIIDVAERIHEDFVRFFRFAIVERKTSKVKQIRAGLSFMLEDGDIVRIYIKR